MIGVCWRPYEVVSIFVFIRRSRRRLPFGMRIFARFRLV
jgi:hypothetical protein